MYTMAEHKDRLARAEAAWRGFQAGYVDACTVEQHARKLRLELGAHVEPVWVGRLLGPRHERGVRRTPL